MKSSGSLLPGTGFWAALAVTLITSWSPMSIAYTRLTPTAPKALRSVIPVKEGFFNLSKATSGMVQQAWPSVFLLLIDRPKSYESGTAFLVGKKTDGDSSILYFLTNRHIIEEDCVEFEICRSTFLAQDAMLSHRKTGLKLEFMSGLVLQNFEVVKISHAPDLALLRVRTLNSPDLPDPLPLPSQCDLSLGENLFTIGFSDTFDRKEPTVMIHDKDKILKRWSVGIYTGPRVNEDLTSSTVDTLGGGSGGPLLNEYGQVVGVQKSTLSLASNDSSYQGNEKAGQLAAQSNAVPCHYLADFIADGVSRFP